jgi:hypothetical protein
MISLVALMVAAQSAMPVQLASSQSADAGSDRQEVVCQRRPTTGSRLRSTRTCMTRQEWDARRESLKRTMSDAVTRAMTNQPPPPTTESAPPR